MLGEDVEDQCDPVDDVHLEQLLEIPLLCRAQLVVKHDDVHVERLRLRCELPGLSAADEQRRVGTISAHERFADGIGSGGIGQQTQLDQAHLGLVGAVAPSHHADEEGALSHDLEVGDGGGQPPPLAASRTVIGHAAMKADGRRPLDGRAA